MKSTCVCLPYPLRFERKNFYIEKSNAPSNISIFMDDLLEYKPWKNKNPPAWDYKHPLAGELIKPCIFV